MNILVTGGAGFIGSHLVERLVGRGDDVVVLDNLNDYYNPDLKRRNITAYSEANTVEFIEGDICDRNLLDSIFSARPLDVVVHLAARAGVRPSLEDPLLYERVNCGGTINMLETCRCHNVSRFVFASSSSVYGNANDVPFVESAQPRPMSPYGATKAAGEVFCRNYHDLYGISSTCLRFFTVYGARQRPDMAIRKFTAMIDNGEPIPFFGDGSSLRDYTYYSDIIDGVTAAVDRDLGFEVLNLGESRTTDLKTLVGLIEKNVGKKANLNHMPTQAGDMNVTYADVSKARQLLDYAPSTTVEDGVAAFVRWYRESCD